MQKLDDGTLILETPDEIEAFRLLAIRGRLKLELSGLKFKGRSTNAFVKQQFGFTGDRTKVLAQFEQMLRDRKILRDEPEIVEGHDERV